MSTSPRLYTDILRRRKKKEIETINQNSMCMCANIYDDLLCLYKIKSFQMVNLLFVTEKR